MSSSVSSVKHSIRISLQLIVAIIRSPLSFWKSVSHSMTGASTTLLLTIIVTLNIVWGYPWVGLFAACSSLLVVGFAVNRLLNPRLETTAKLPQYVQVGESFPVQLELLNKGRLPALDINVGFGREYRVVNMFAPRRYIGTILSGHRAESRHEMRFDVRGIHPLPAVYVESLFPFSLFRATRICNPQMTVPVTPKLLKDADMAVANPQLFQAVGKLIRSAAGDSMEYSGSREYQVGMPVRQWDFASWARLGRPIVREFSSPTQESVTLVVDTSFDVEIDVEGNLSNRRVKKQESAARSADLENLLSLAASVITRLCSASIRITMLVTSEGLDGERSSASRDGVADPAPLLIRLALAEEIESQVAYDRIGEFVKSSASASVMVLTFRSPATITDALPSGACVIRCQPETRESRTPTMKMRRHPPRHVV